jgi:hypothetical protein
MTSPRTAALIAGAFYVLTFVSIPTLSLYVGIHDPGFITGPGPDTPVIIGGLLELIVGLTGIGTAIALYPVVRRQDEWRAIGFVATRTLEGSMIFAGVASLLTIVTLRQAGVGEGGVVIAQALVALYDRLFLVGQSLMPEFNALLLGSLLYQSRLVPRALPTLGLIGAPILLAANLAVMFGVIDRISPLAALPALPIALWEFSLGVWLLVKGFNADALAALMSRSRE